MLLSARVVYATGKESKCILCFCSEMENTNKNNLLQRISKLMAHFKSSLENAYLKKR